MSLLIRRGIGSCCSPKLGNKRSLTLLARSTSCSRRRCYTNIHNFSLVGNSGGVPKFHMRDIRATIHPPVVVLGTSILLHDVRCRTSRRISTHGIIRPKLIKDVKFSLDCSVHLSDTATAIPKATMSLIRPAINTSASDRQLSAVPLDIAGLRSQQLLVRGKAGDYRHFSSKVDQNNDGRNNRNPSFSTSAKIPTPSSPPASGFSSFDAAALARGAITFSVGSIRAIGSFLLKLPYNTWYYLTQPEERRAKIAEIIDITKKEVHHYWMGTKLLMADVRTARTLLGRTLSGSALTRRERKQLLRTVSDLFRLVPFSMFLVIPFMEFALPFALRIFPNLLPSTFQDSLKAEENMKRELQSRIAMAQFFQETLEELAKEQKRIASKRVEENSEERAADDDAGKADTSKAEIASKQEQSAASMLEFLDRARSGEMIPPDIIIQYANYFQDDLTLDNMPRMQLINMCKYMSIPPYGSDAFLRFQLRHRIRSLKEDDQRILWEGIGSLTKMELREACQERGMRSTGLSKEAYRKSLQQWLDLSVNKNVPIALLIMSRTFFLHEEMFSQGADDDTKSVTGLADAISGLDKEVLNEVILEVATSEENKSSPDVRAIKLEVLAQQNERIRQELAEREAAAKKKESAEKEASDKAESPASEKELLEEPVVAATSKSGRDEHFDVVVVDAKPAIGSDSSPNDDLDKEKDNLSTSEMEAITQLLSADPVSRERAELERIKSAMHAEDEEEESPESSDKVEEVPLANGKPAKAELTGGQQEELVSSDADPVASSQIKELEDKAKAAAEASESTIFTTESEILPSISEQDQSQEAEAVEAVNASEQEDPVVARLKKRIESMVAKIEGQLSDVQVKIGDKLHFLDKDMDGILSREEMADCLQQVLKRKITFEEAMEIASEMDGNQDGVFTVQELIHWIETNRLVKLEEEGRDADMDRILEEWEEDEKEVDTDRISEEQTKTGGKLEGQQQNS